MIIFLLQDHNKVATQQTKLCCKQRFPPFGQHQHGVLVLIKWWNCDPKYCDVPWNSGLEVHFVSTCLPFVPDEGISSSHKNRRPMMWQSDKTQGWESGTLWGCQKHVHLLMYNISVWQAKLAPSNTQLESCSMKIAIMKNVQRYPPTHLGQEVELRGPMPNL